MKETVWCMIDGGDCGADAGRDDMPSSLEAGQVYSFMTRPLTEFSPPSTGRFAAIKILGVNDRHVVVAVLDGIWAEAPMPNEVGVRASPIEHRFANVGRAAVFGVNRAWWKPDRDLDQFAFAGKHEVSPDDQLVFTAVTSGAPDSCFGVLQSVNSSAEGEWRWANDRDAFVIEIERKEAKDAAGRVAQEERYRSRLSKLTWQQLESETPFARWAPSPPFPSDEFTNAARATIRSACGALKALGPKPRRADVRAILKKTVIWFNNADEKAGGVIETEEREEIYAVLEEMAYVARQRVLVDEIDEWCEW